MDIVSHDVLIAGVKYKTFEALIRDEVPAFRSDGVVFEGAIEQEKATPCHGQEDDSRHYTISKDTAQELHQEKPFRRDEVRYEELSKGLRKGKWTLIDCRNETELEDPGMIPGSYNIPLHEATAAFKLTEQEFFKKYGFRKPDPGNDRVAVSCRSGKRAEEFLDQIRTIGYSNFKLYKGSFLDWVDRGGEVISKKQTRDL